MAFNTAVTGAKFYEKSLAVTAHNIAAQGAHGYKKEYLVGTTLGYKNDNFSGIKTSEETTAPSELSLGLGVQAIATHRDFSQGDPIETGNPYDLMISGDGFFPIQLPDGTIAYTRSGAFDKSATGQLVMPKTGYALSPEVSIPTDAIEGSIAINEAGQISVLQAGNPAPQIVGQIQIVNFTNNNGLRAGENSLFFETESSGSPVYSNPSSNNAGRIRQKYLEGSNVNAVEEMTNLIKTQSRYDESMKVLKAGNEMLKASTNTQV